MIGSPKHLYLLLLFLCGNAFGQDLSAIGQLARDGAPGLAIRLIDDIQPDAAENISGWLFFERQRIEIMRDWQLWDRLLERLNGLPANSPAEFSHWARVEAANAQLQLGQGAKARQVLRRLLWQPPANLNEGEFSLYRRLVIRSYLVDDNLQDAKRAMLRYQQDYGSKGFEWQKLQARVFLRIGRDKDANRLLKDADAGKSELLALRLLAQLRSRNRPPEAILGEARDTAAQEGTGLVDKARLWRVGAEAAAQLSGRLSLTRALEQAALLSHALPADDLLFQMRGDELWDAYRRYAMEEGNKLQLLIGQDTRWLKEADKWREQRPQRARAFYSIVMFDGSTISSRRYAYQEFIATIQAIPDGVRLLRKLFLDAERFADTQDIPNRVRYLLVDDALSVNDIVLATRLMSGLEQPPEGSDAAEWGLRRARVLTLGGRHADGIAILNTLTTDISQLEAPTRDRLVQVIFDLQTVGKHQEAVGLFNSVLRQTVNPKLRRELLFWQADSYKAMQQFPKAAWLYLRSATLLDAIGMDPWGQTARFRAAESLAEAGLIEDARRLYQGLMKVTPEPGRRAMIKYKLQELWLK